MEMNNTLLLKAGDARRLLTIQECMDAVAQAFRLYAEANAMAPKVMAIHTGGGGFHLKAGMLNLSRAYFVAKVNANFPGNAKQYGLPTIQGIVAVCDGSNGRLLALVDSIEITIIRTGAATGIAAQYLARPDATVATICGCGNQGRISLKALLCVRKLQRVYAFDTDRRQTEQFMMEFREIIEVVPIDAEDLPSALAKSHVCITCTPSKQPFVQAGYLQPGTFVAAVGADSEEKQELFPGLFASSKIVTDSTEQCAAFGELHHALEKKLVTVADVHAELGMIIAGLKPGRETEEEIIIFDSTGTALQDVAAAAIVYEKAVAMNLGIKLNFSQRDGEPSVPGPGVAVTNRLRSFFPFR